ncbi:MAG: zinc-binding alcohol dehydrogenase family protein [Burkholderiaceae bacterium]|uniref:Zinc-type alcohol dehydrogenase-like protein n=1 Tax=Herminiimonas contaminans TaxID=1111140 RepID=A0ABS0ER58_9BURK|nr:zinc-binding alcohol dehydrogenase family protein [Herminiimonas contaminans]MBF8177338.1 zinc-binding alcohol dehydrogenase family protein [Herminiimonas contaminans]MBX9799946.1 zinc-binding alcohol dehydrogenase family protein [Burkholderiaceae bacterium]
MKAVAYQQALPIKDQNSLLDVTLPDPVASGHDLLVEVQAISVNPVDVKVRSSATPPDGEYKVIGWDAAGIVRAVGDAVTLFKPGDRVFYAGSIARPGTNSELHLVDEFITGHMPASLDFAQAAALPLTAITAWELLFERLEVQTDSKEAILIIGAAGGVGSILVQLARQLTGLTVIGTASRPQTQQWVRELGAHHVIDHSLPLSQELKKIGIENVKYVASLNQTDQHFAEIVEALAPQGKLALIDDPVALDCRLLKRKSISLHWEFMFTRALFATADMHKQHELLNEVARLIDAGTIKTTVAENFGTINAANLKRAHSLLESNTAKGKIVLEGF